MAVRRYEQRRKGFNSYPMRWTRNADGTYHIIVTSNTLEGLSTRRAETYEYDSPTLPATGGAAWRKGAREYRKEHETPEAAKEARSRAVLSVVGTLIFLLITWMLIQDGVITSFGH
jgi:hypothetical protein